MTLKELKQLFLIINNAYNGFAYDQVKAAVWHEFLKDFPLDLALRNLRRHVDTKPFPPTIAEIKRLEDGPVIVYEQLDVTDPIVIRMMQAEDAWKRRQLKGENA